MRAVVAGAAVLALLIGAQGVMARAVTITYWGEWSGVNGKAEKEAIDKFNKLYDGKIFVKATPMDDPEAKTLVAIAGGVSPDCFKLDRFRVGSWAAKDLLVCLDPTIKKEKIDTAIWYKPTYGETVYGGRCYALPWNTDDRALMFNKTMFSQVGLDVNNPPKIWEELTVAAKKLDLVDANGKYVRGGINPLAGNWWYNGWLYSVGGDITKDNGRKANWNSPQGLKALNYINDFMKKYGGYQKMSAIGDLWSNKMGMELNGSWQIGTWKATKNKKFELGVAPPPRPMGLEKETKSWAGGFALCLPRGSRHQKEAWTFMKWYCADYDAQLTIARGTGLVPVLNKAARSQDFLQQDPLFDVFTAIMPEATFRTVIPCGMELWTYYADGPESVTAYTQKGLKSPEDILAVTQTQAQKQLDRSWARVRRL